MRPFLEVLVVLAALIGTSVGNRPSDRYPCSSRESCPSSQYRRENRDAGGYPRTYKDSYEYEPSSRFTKEQGGRQPYGRKTDEEYDHAFSEYNRKGDSNRGAREGYGRGYSEGYGSRSGERYNRGSSDGYGRRSSEKYGRAPDREHGREFREKFDPESRERYGRGDGGGYDHGPDGEYKPERDEYVKKYDDVRDGVIFGGGHGYEYEEEFGGIYGGSYNIPSDFIGDDYERYGRFSGGRAGNSEEQNDEEGEANRTQRPRNAVARGDNTQNQARADRESTPNTDFRGVEATVETEPSNLGGSFNGFLPNLRTGSNGGFANGFGGNFGQGLGVATNAGDSGVAVGGSQ